MDAVLLIGGLVLAAVLATAGVAKLFDFEGSRRAVAAFGVPPRLASPLGTLLPPVELATAALLVVGTAGSEHALLVGALSALALLTFFCGGIALSLARGRAPDCHCFGQLHSGPASGRTLARNGALLTVAAFVASGGHPTWTAAGALAVIATLVLVGFLSPGGGAEGAEQAMTEGLPLGIRAPGFELATLDGPPLSLAGLLRRGRPVLLVFTDPDCGPCIALAPALAEWQRDHADDLTIAPIEKGGRRPPASPDEHGRRHVLLQRDGQIADAYRAGGTPSAVLVGADGRVASRVASGRPAIEQLLARTVPDFEPRGAAWSATPLARRELLARAAAAYAAAMGLIASPVGAAGGQLELRCRHERCGDRCCPRKARCRGQGNRKVCVCPDGRPACGGRCCPETFICRRRGRRRRCVCPDGYIACSGRCLRARTDPRHCGRCGRTCPRGTSCVDGVCVGGDGTGTGPGGSGGCDCPPGKTCCEGVCTDLNASEEHCGECGQACAEGKTCCDGHCRSLEQDPRNCGRCRRRCASNEVCSEGECRRRCRGGLRNCRGRCVDVKSDPKNCDRCGFSCSGPFDTGECCAGTCCDINGDTCCPGGCKNLALDNKNCGSCGNVCGPNSFCRFGTCVCPEQPCP